MFDVKPIVSPKPTDCGATCLQMLLAYYDIEVSLETLTKECNTGFNGCTAGDIMRAGRKHGLNDIKSFSMDAAEVVRQDRPSIVWWKYRHFCVCCGLDDNGKVVVCNPDRGRYRMSEGVFRSFYSGVSIWKGEPEWIPGTNPEEEE